MTAKSMGCSQRVLIGKLMALNAYISKKTKYLKSVIGPYTLRKLEKEEKSKPLKCRRIKIIKNTKKLKTKMTEKSYKAKCWLLEEITKTDKPLTNLPKWKREDINYQYKVIEGLSIRVLKSFITTDRIDIKRTVKGYNK